MIRILCADLLGADEETYRLLYAAAGEERRQRADRYRRREDALRCLAAGALLREALRRRFGTSEGFTLQKGIHGKPFVTEAPDFHFSLSHSGRWAAIAAGHCEVGLDVQENTPGRDAEALAKRFFAEAEIRHLQARNWDPHVFTKIWTAKEAYVKYLGTGLTKSLVSFSVFELPGLQLHWETLEGGYSLCLCGEEETCSLELLPLEAL